MFENKIYEIISAIEGHREYCSYQLEKSCDACRSLTMKNNLYGRYDILSIIREAPRGVIRTKRDDIEDCNER